MPGLCWGCHNQGKVPGAPPFTGSCSSKSPVCSVMQSYSLGRWTGAGAGSLYPVAMQAS